jgi:hypothetical protein
MSGLAMTGVLTDENGKKYKFSLEEIATQQPPTGSTDPAPSTPQTATLSIPLSPKDARFTNNVKSGPAGVAKGTTLANKTIVDTSDAVSLYFGNSGTVKDCCVQSREGIRVAGGGEVVVDGCYIEVNGIGADHADGLQTYAPGKRGTITVRNSTFKCGLNAATAGFFVADNWTGTIDFDGVVLWGGPYGVRIHPDKGGDNIIRFKDVFFVGPFKWGAMRLEDVGGHKNKIELWENVREATIVNGVLVPGKAIPKPF